MPSTTRTLRPTLSFGPLQGPAGEPLRPHLPRMIVCEGGEAWASVCALGGRDVGEAAAARVVAVEAAGGAEAPAWLPSARASVEAAIDAMERSLPGAALLLWPHASGAISDAPSLRTFLRTRGVAAGGRWRFILDPVALMTPAMHANAEDHLARWREVLVTHPDLAAVVACERSPLEPGPDQPTPLMATGGWTRLLLASLAGLNPGVPVILAGEARAASETQRDLLASAGLL